MCFTFVFNYTATKHPYVVTIISRLIIGKAPTDVTDAKEDSTFPSPYQDNWSMMRDFGREDLSQGLKLLGN